MAKIAVLTTRTGRYHPNRRLLEAAHSLGHDLFLVHPKNMQPTVQKAKRGSSNRLPFVEVFIPRIGGTIDDYELAVVFHIERTGVAMVNGFSSLMVARDKFLSLRLLESRGLPIPRTYLVREPQQLAAAVEDLGGLPVVMKSRRGRQGTTVHLVDKMDYARYIVNHPPRSAEGVLVQEFIPTAAAGDIRILVVGGRLVAAMRRIPRKDDFRSNRHLKGKGVPWKPLPGWIELARRATEALGLQISGVDLMETDEGPVVLEVNTTPGFRELERVTGVDVAREIILSAAGLGDGEEVAQ